MKTIRNVVALLAVAVAFSAQAYQVTGEVVEVSDSKIVVKQEKGKNKGEKFEMTRGADTKVTGDLVKGATATVEYTIAAKSVEVKAAKAPKAAKAKKK
jgi:hypothetical protein